MRDEKYFDKLKFEFQTEQDNLLKSQEMYIGNLSVEERTIVNKCTEPDEGGKIKFDPIVNLASHEDTFNTGKLFPVKCLTISSFVKFRPKIAFSTNLQLRGM